VAGAEEDSEDDELLELCAAGVITTGVPGLSGMYKGPFKPQPDTSAENATTIAIRNTFAPA
jgi:hypothetical protein